MSLVVIGRDGVINEEVPGGVKSLAQWVPIEGSIDAIAKLSKFGFTVVIATNQPGLGEGSLELDQLEAIHNTLRDRVETRGGNIAGIFYCPHRADEQCHCRKPNTGLIDAIELELQAPIHEVPLIGHRQSDVELALATGATPLLVRTGQGVHTAQHYTNTGSTNTNSTNTNTPPEIFNSLSDAADYVIRFF
ncbi:D-glycero-alpha-D-manno-heptose-1,7-bisphosphate 7-phosphatase [Marinibactrum halimedae]|uniref:D,D-heptose 1,7-bisphosphate phosphatase n=1 Tax=Marinibactrum halimedae TaxID=1444977 RepID=A0AA37T6Z4_9GAMM|nr:HAD-IIIA family hydrolase [Marinibactrum halimedae]MCD9460032.1 HAD-IIIA family hydrolase [Marinibactrum halimedae]GLS28200.1 D,D-heptose 1,7-bisphosphate phosphatase [Marinibactrum halimedae]